MPLRTLLYLGKEEILNTLKIRRKPKVIQMPITSRCNSRCVTCNIWKEHTKTDINPEKLKKVLSSSFFSDVNMVGLNGGELTLVPNFFEILDAVFTLPKLKYIHLISNGLLPDKLLPLLEKVKEKCDKKGIQMGFTLSVDGVGKTHELIRGVPKCFERTKRILDTFKTSPNKYFSQGVIGCTLSRDNIYYVREMEEFFNNYPMFVEWHLAVPNKRIHTFNNAENYYILNDERARLLAAEFFYDKMCNAKRFEKFRWFAQYYFLINKGDIRLAQCGYRYRDITIDENLFLYLCATASEKIGDLNKETIAQIQKKNRFSKEANQLKNNCNQCVHYIYNNPTLKGGWIFLKYLLNERFKWGKKFEYLAKW